MPHQVIFEDGAEALTINFDPNDSGLPISVNGEWLERDEALKAAGAILAALDAEQVQPTGDLNESLLAVAIAHDRPVNFRYAKGDESFIENRSLRPGEVREVKGKKLVIGFDISRNDVRAYRLDRIKGQVEVV